MQRYVEMVVQEIAASRRLNRQPLQSVFFGGGEARSLMWGGFTALTARLFPPARTGACIPAFSCASGCASVPCTLPVAPCFHG